MLDMKKNGTSLYFVIRNRHKKIAALLLEDIVNVNVGAVCWGNLVITSWVQRRMIRAVKSSSIELELKLIPD